AMFSSRSGPQAICVAATVSSDIFAPGDTETKPHPQWRAAPTLDRRVAPSQPPCSQRHRFLMRHFIDTQDFSKAELLDLIQLIHLTKDADKQGALPPLLSGTSLGM